MNRRQFLTALGGAAVLGGTSAIAVLAGGPPGQTGTPLRSLAPHPARFVTPLPRPPELDVSGADGEREVEIRQRPAELAILPGQPTVGWTYDGSFPGPTFRARRGRPITVRFYNELPVGTAVHLHGGRTPAASDGYPTDLILPADGTPVHQHMLGDTTEGVRTYEYPLDQRAATLWYHDHAMDFTGPNVYRGLAGLFLLDDDDDALPLPRGERELPLVICDRAFDADNQFRYPALSPAQHEPGVEDRYMGGVLGDVILVNGAPWPVAEVDRARYRLRVLNASNARRYELSRHPAPDDRPAFTQIGTDGGLLERPLPRRTVTLAAAERADLVVDFGAYPVGTDVDLRNDLGRGSTADVMRFRVARNTRDDTAVPGRLSTIEPLDPVSAVATRTFHFQLRRDPEHHGDPDDQGFGAHRWMVNGHSFDPELDLATPQLGDVEIWRFLTDVHHPVHLHLAHFQVLSRNGRDPGVGDRGWKDTIDLLPAETAEIVVRFDGYRGRYVFHCHNLEHEDMAMMANFTVR